VVRRSTWSVAPVSIAVSFQVDSCLEALCLQAPSVYKLAQLCPLTFTGVQEHGRHRAQNEDGGFDPGIALQANIRTSLAWSSALLILLFSSSALALDFSMCCCIWSSASCLRKVADLGIHHKCDCAEGGEQCG